MSIYRDRGYLRSIISIATQRRLPQLSARIFWWWDGWRWRGARRRHAERRVSNFLSNRRYFYSDPKSVASTGCNLLLNPNGKCCVQKPPMHQKPHLFEIAMEAHPRIWRQTDCALWKSRWRIHLFGRGESWYRWETSIHLDGFIKTEYPITRIFNRSDSHRPRTSPWRRYVFGVDVQLRTQFFRGKHRPPQISSKGFIKQFWSYITKC